MKREVDPIHFFDEFGRSLESYLELERQNQVLRAENDRLRQIAKALKRRLDTDKAQAKPDESTSLH